MDLTEKLMHCGFSEQHANSLTKTIQSYLMTLTPEQAWETISQTILPSIKHFAIHHFLYHMIYPHAAKVPAPAWFPTKYAMTKSNIAKTLAALKFKDYPALHAWSIQHVEAFWQYTIEQLSIIFHQPYGQICNLSQGIENPQWFFGAILNITESCFQAEQNAIAIISQQEGKPIQQMTYQELESLSNRVANSLLAQGLQKGDCIAIIMPLNPLAVAIYLGIIKIGATVVSIAESFAPDEMKTRCQITNAKLIFTQDFILRHQKYLALYEKVATIENIRSIVLSCDETSSLNIKQHDIAWCDFLLNQDKYNALSCAPNFPSNILFSSGTTGEPKAIVWDHTTPIKCASDAYYHCDVKPNDIIAIPTSLGWMMGPWLIYASLINRATMAIFDGAPTTTSFGEFVQEAKITILGVVPSLVAAWRANNSMASLDWTSLKLFFSTGECSNNDDMLYLMSLAHYKPIIEYCGGTEIGGAYITSTLMQPNVPGMFTTPALGIDFVMLNDNGDVCRDGEVALIPPCIGLSTKLLNQDHHHLYFSGMPFYQGKPLRRHGDHVQQINLFYRNLGRIDDTMNLGGIKVSAAEIEQILVGIEGIQEIAAIAVTPPRGGPSLLVIFTVILPSTQINSDKLPEIMQQVIKTRLNPLFKIHEIIIVNSLPRTASNKIMRRALRDSYQFLS